MTLAEGPPPGSGQARRETKYAFPRGDLPGLRRHLLDVCRRIRFHRDVSEVRSIYFDDENLSACRANLDGIGRRRKVRLRWYDRAAPGSTGFFEIKWRRNVWTGKERREIRCQPDLRDWSYRQIRSGLSRVLADEHEAVLARHPDPVVLVGYQREHFFSPELRARLTLDYDLTFYDQRGASHPKTGTGHSLPEFVILEVKTAGDQAAGLQRILHPFRPRPSKCSKYVYGCRELGLIPGLRYSFEG
jgi:hypothetical protein